MTGTRCKVPLPLPFKPGAPMRQAALPVYDPQENRWNGRADIIKEKFVPFGQGHQSMSPALRDLESIILEKKVRHGDHPLLKMCASNCVMERDAAGNRKLLKKTLDGQDRRHGRFADGVERRAAAHGGEVRRRGADWLRMRKRFV